MKLGDFLTNVPPGTGSAPKERVEFRLVARSTKDGSLKDAPAYATFVLASDKDHQEAEIAALKSLQDLRKDLEVVPGFLLESRRRAEILVLVMRDYDDPREGFAGTADDLQRHLPRHEMERLSAAYDAWVARWYPKSISKEQRSDLKHEALGK